MINVSGMKKQTHFVWAYQDFPREEGVPSALRRDQAKNEKSKEVMKIHRELLIKDAFSEAGNQQQNPVEAHAVRR